MEFFKNTSERAIASPPLPAAASSLVSVESVTQQTQELEQSGSPGEKAVQGSKLLLGFMTLI
uniref:Uncharacterized protein n=1 Tax=Oryza rufipogon TaxID=4529 RepID=A0A0E0PB68_ORYRU